MAKRRSRDHLAVSLFPFLSILACVIGVLTLMITALALGQISEPGDDPAAVARAEEYLRLQEELRQSNAAVASTSGQYEKWKKIVDELDQARAHAKRLAKEKSDAEKTTTDAAKVQEETDRLAKEIATAKAELAKLAGENESLAIELEKQGKEREPAVKIQPGGSGVNLKPTFVECAAAGLVIYANNAAVAVPTANIATNEAFLKLLDRVADSPGSTIVFLVRPKGMATYQTARTLARSKSAHNGKLPVPGEGRIDLSFFANPSPPNPNP